MDLKAALVLGLKAAGLAALAVLAVLFWVQHSRIESLQKDLERSEAGRAKAEAALKAASISLNQERAAADERAERLNASSESHRALEKELADCDLDGGWTVPRALYERLCRPAPGP